MKKLLMTIVLMPMMAMALELSPSYSTEAVAKYKEIADSGDAEAQFLYARALVNGDGAKKNSSGAFDYAKRSAGQGFELSYRLVGVGHECGWGGISNATEAAVWYGKFLDWANPAAEQGNAWAQFQLGLCFELGNGVAKDAKEAVTWYRKAAEQGCAMAQGNLGRCYRYGRGVETNLVEAAKWSRNAAEQGYAHAQADLGYCYEYGRGIDKNLSEAVRWYRKAADQGNAMAQNNLGACYDKGAGVEKNPEAALNLYRKSAEQGYAYAQVNLGRRYEEGFGVGTNFVEAAKWYRKAAEQGDARAQGLLGRCYEHGKGVNKDLSEAVKWYRKSAEQGDVSAQCILGWCYEKGRMGSGVPRNLREAVNWYLKAADRGNAWAQMQMGECYENGQGVKKNPAEGVKWYRKAAEQGYDEAQCALGLCYMQGSGVETNYVEAVKWYRKAAEQSSLSAFLGQSALGMCYENGWGVATDKAEAVKWYQKAAAQDWGSAQYHLVVCYAIGDGVERDLKEAVKWYCRYAKQPCRQSGDPEKEDEGYRGGLKRPVVTDDELVAKAQKAYDALAALSEKIKGASSEIRAAYDQDLSGAKFRMDRAKKRCLKGKGSTTVKAAAGMSVVAQKLQGCDFLVNELFKQNAKVYLCLYSALCSPKSRLPVRREMPRIAKMYAEKLKADPDIELINFSRDQDDEKAMFWAKELDVKFPVVAPDGCNPLNLPLNQLHRRIPHLYILKADGTLLEEGHPMKLFTEEKIREFKMSAASASAQAAAGKQQAEQAATEAERQAQTEREKAQREAECAELRQLAKRVRDAKAAAAKSEYAASCVTNNPTSGKGVVAEKLQTCDFLLNKDFKKDAKFFLCLFSASWCPPCRREMPRIAKTYAETLKDDPDIELIHFSRDQNDEKALAWAKEHDVKFPVVKPKGGNPLDLHSRGIPHLFIVKDDGTLLEEGHPMKLFTDEKIRALKGR